MVNFWGHLLEWLARENEIKIEPLNKEPLEEEEDKKDPLRIPGTFLETLYTYHSSSDLYL